MDIKNYKILVGGNEIKGIKSADLPSIAMEKEVPVASFSQVTVVTHNTKYEPRSFTVDVPKDAKFIKPLWDYDETGEPVNVRLVEVGP